MPRREVFDHVGHYYQVVAANDELVHDTVVPNGSIWHLVRFIASGAYLDDTTVALWWDRGGTAEQLLAAVHGDSEIPIELDVTGDGSRKLSIVLSNDTSASHALGGRWEARDD